MAETAAGSGDPTGVGVIRLAVVADDEQWGRDFVAAHREHPIDQMGDVEQALQAAGTNPTLIVVRAGDPDRSLAALGGGALDRPGVDVVLVTRGLDVDLLRRAMAAGVSDVTADARPGDSVLWESVEAAIERLAARVGAAAPRPGRVLHCTAAAGGQGTSLVAANLAVTLATTTNQRVVLMEGDHRFGDLREMMGLLGCKAGGPSVDERFGATWLGDHLHRHEPSGVTVLLPPVEYATMEDFPPAVVVEALGLLQSMSDFVVVDSPFWLSETCKVPAWSDLTLLVTRDAPRYLAKARTAARALKGYEGTTRLVISDYVNGRTPRRKDLAEVIGLETIGRIPETEDLMASVAAGEPLVLSEPDGDYARGVGELADAAIEWLDSV